LAEISISIAGDKVAARKLVDLDRAMPQQIKRGFYRAGALFEREMKLRLSGRALKVVTGRLRNSVNPQVSEEAGGIVLRVGPNVKYAAIHEFGGVIKPKNGPFLHFKGSFGWVKVGSVTIPKRPYVKPTLNENLDRAMDIIQREIMKPLGR